MINKLKSKGTIIFIVDILIALAIIFATYYFVVKAYNYTFNSGKSMLVDKDLDNVLPTSITITNKTTVKELAVILKENGVIKSTNYFIYENTLFGNKKSVLPGTYSVKAGMSNINLLEAFYENKSKVATPSPTPPILPPTIS